MYPRASPTESALHVSKSDRIRFVLDYEIAFSFDQSVGLDLPSEGCLVRPADVDGLLGRSVGSDDGLSTVDTSEPLSRARMEIAGSHW